MNGAAAPRHASRRAATRRRVLRACAVLFAALLAAAAFGLLCGSERLDLGRALDRSIPAHENVDASILTLRAARVCLAAVVGAAFAISGVALQALLQNALASPFTLGVSSGASFGAVVAILGGVPVIVGGLSPIPLAAAAGALLAVALVYGLGRRSGALDTTALLLAGVTVNFFFGAAVLFLQAVSDPHGSIQIVHWLMGSVDAVRPREALGPLAFVAAALAVITFFARDLNLLSVGGEVASTLGVDVRVARRVVFIAASVATGAAVAAAGPIGFVGLLVPHALRLRLGPDHRVLVPASALAGAAFLVTCDTVARSKWIFGATLPVGVLTSFIGCPAFLWLLHRTRAR